MKARINRQFLEQTSFDSSSPGELGVVVHQFDRPGEYVVTCREGKEIIDERRLSVTDEPLKAAPGPNQVAINFGRNLRGFASSRTGQSEGAQAREQDQRQVLAANGFATFSTSDTSGDYEVTVELADGKGKKRELFNNRRLESNDTFAVTLVRPGKYSVENTIAKAKGEITVAYPKIEKRRYRPPSPISVQCTKRGFEPSSVDLKPAQGIIFRFDIPSRIKIDLVKPDDGPKKSREARRRGWKKPPQPKPKSKQAEDDAAK